MLFPRLISTAVTIIKEMPTGTKFGVLSLGQLQSTPVPFISVSTSATSLKMSRPTLMLSPFAMLHAHIFLTKTVIDGQPRTGHRHAEDLQYLSRGIPKM